MSSEGDSFYEDDVDGIRYVNAGCGGYRTGDPYWRQYQYYKMDFDGRELSVEPGRVSMSGKQE